jgi:hypothetical protein
LTAFSLTIQTVISFAIVINLLILISVGFIKRYYLSILFNNVTKHEQRFLRSEFLNAVTRKNYLIAAQYHYQYALLKNRQMFTPGCSESIILNQLAFNADNIEKVPLSFSANDAKALISKIDISASKKENTANFTPNEHINLKSK